MINNDVIYTAPKITWKVHSMGMLSSDIYSTLNKSRNKIERLFILIIFTVLKLTQVGQKSILRWWEN